MTLQDLIQEEILKEDSFRWDDDATDLHRWCGRLAEKIKKWSHCAEKKKCSACRGTGRKFLSRYGNETFTEKCPTCDGKG